MFLWLTRFKIKRMIKTVKSMQQYREHNQPTDVVLQKEIAIYLVLSKVYKGLIGKKKCPFAREQSIAALRAASMLNDAGAQYALGKITLDEAIFRADQQASLVFASENNQHRMVDLYAEAHALLISATQLNHIQARRLLGLCYINGWGVTVDKDHGFDLVIASIEQENSWDRVQKVFAEIGINKSAFFSELFQHRNKK